MRANNADTSPLIPILVLFLVALGVSCSTSKPSVTGSTAPKDWVAWRLKRLESVAGTNGWTTLVGLHWLKEGANAAGSSPANQVVLQAKRAPGWIGTFVRHGDKVEFRRAPGVKATIQGHRVKDAALENDAEGHPTLLKVGALTINVVQRGERTGLRVRDPEIPARRHFRGLEYFPYDPQWRLSGRFVPFTPPKTMRVPDIIGVIEEYPSPGAVVFQYLGTEYHLDVAVEPDEEDYFVMFHDLTAGKTTYHSGRFFYVAKPDKEGHVVIDFNRAYNPPCAFTAFATCPLPPRQNWLPFEVPVGELPPAEHPVVE